MNAKPCFKKMNGNGSFTAVDILSLKSNNSSWDSPDRTFSYSNSSMVLNSPACKLSTRNSSQNALNKQW